jgi:hypothetical protein
VTTPAAIIRFALGIDRQVATAVVVHTGDELRRVRAGIGAVAQIDLERTERLEARIVDLERRLDAAGVPGVLLEVDTDL